MQLFILLLSLLTTVSASVIDPRAACNADNCLRAVRATQFGSRGFNDCLSYWQTTYTPPTQTQYTTETAPATVTETLTLTTTTTVPVSLTVQTPSTSTVTLPTTFTNIQTMGIQFNKRQQLPGPVQQGNTIPSYASACSGTIRYSSACSCIGISTISTITAPSPVTLLTETTTETATETVTTYIQTDSLTTTVATVTVPSILPSTVYSGPTATVSLFALQITSPQSYAGQYLKQFTYNSANYQGLLATSNQNEALPIYMHSNGRLSIPVPYWPGTFWAGAIPPSVNNLLFVPEQDFLFGTSALSCSIGPAPGRAFTCSTPGWNTFAMMYGSVVWVKDAASKPSAAIVITLKAVPAPLSPP
ncbi:hypothetical protein TWF281_010648 [Arthrobotrys megalospora]